MSDSTECLFGDGITNPEQDLDEQMFNLSLTSSQSHLKQDVNDKLSIKDMQISNDIPNNCEIPLTPDFAHYIQQHDFSHCVQNNRYYQRGIHRKFINQSMVHLRGMFSRARGPKTLSSGDSNNNFSLEPYQQDLSIQCHPTELESYKSSKDQSYKKSRRDIIQFHHRFFKGRHRRDRTHDSALLLPREN